MDTGLAGRVALVTGASSRLGHRFTQVRAKAGVAHMTHAMAREWGRHGINTNAICPGYIAAEISADFLVTDAGQRMVQSLPRRRMGEPRDLDGLLLCAAEASRFTNGAVIAADDGFTSF